jgi:hypothetical protein
VIEDCEGSALKEDDVAVAFSLEMGELEGCPPLHAVLAVPPYLEATFFTLWCRGDFVVGAEVSVAVQSFADCTGDELQVLGAVERRTVPVLCEFVEDGVFNPGT